MAQRSRGFRILLGVTAGSVLALAVLLAALGQRDWQGAQRVWLDERHEENAREGFAARAHFELVSIRDVPGISDASPRDPRPGRITYLLNEDEDAYTLRGRELRHVRYVTLIWGGEGGGEGEGEGEAGEQTSPFVLDLYLHGDPDSDSRLALRIPGLDIRKFLHQSVAPIARDQGLARLQAYFAEFSRAAKTIYRERPEAADAVSLTPYELGVLERLRVERASLKVDSDERSASVNARLGEMLEQLDQPETLDRSAVDTILRLGLAGIQNKRKQLERDETATAPEHFDELEADILGLSAARKIRLLKLTNNCREPGNYEVAVTNWLGNPLLKSSFTFSTQHYDEILAAYNGLGVAAQGTGVRVPEALRWRDLPHYWDSLLPWRFLRNFPRVNLEALGLLAPVDASSAPVATGEIEVGWGRIPFDEYEFEVRSKSAYRMFIEPLSFVQVDPGKPMPKGFQSPDPHQQPLEYWEASANEGKVVAHKYVFFSDLQDYEVHLSGFEASGVYIGRSDLERFDKERRAGRWHFDYGYLADLERFVVAEQEGGRLQIRLLSSAEPDAAVNFVFGNVSVPVGESVEYLFGIATQPLSSDYNENVFQTPPLYAFALGNDGTVLDHHDLRIGVERVYVERLDEETLKLRLISHERILPVWEGVVSAPGRAPG